MVNRGNRGGAGGLLPFSHFALGNTGEAAKLERLRQAWPLMVSPGLGRDTHPISIANGLLLIGCHNTFALKSMRACAESAWPDLRRRIDAAIGTHMQRIEITPSDPPEQKSPFGLEGQGRAKGGAEAAKGKGGGDGSNGFDPLEAVLAHYGRAKRGWGGG